MRRNHVTPGSMIVTGALAAGLTVWTAGAPAATDFGPIIPENVFVAVWAEDLPALEQSFSESAYGQFWNDPDTAPLREWFNSQIEGLVEAAEEEAEISLQDLKAALSGGVAFYLQSPADGIIDMTTEPQSVILIEVDEDGKAFFQELLEGLPDKLDWQDVRRESVEAAGLEGYKVSGTDQMGEERQAVYAFSENHLILTYQDDDGALAVAADRVQNPRLDGSIGGRQEIRRLGTDAITAPNRYSAYLDIGLILRNTALSGDVEPQIRRAVERSGLADMEGLLLTGSVDADKTDSDLYVLTTPQRRGLHQALYAAGPTPLDLVQNVSADATSVTSFSLDVGRLYSAIMDIVTDVEPQMAAMVEMMILGQFAAYGIDPVNDLLNNISGEHVYVSRALDPELEEQLPDYMRGMQDSQAMFFGLRNGDNVVRALKTLLDNVGQDPDMGQMISYREEDGITFVDFQMPMEEGPVSPQFAFSPQAIIYTNNAIEMREAVRTLKGESSQPLSEDPGFRRALDGVDRASTHSFTYQPSSAMDSLAGQLQTVFAMGILDEFLPGFDASMIPDGHVWMRHFGDSYGTGGFHEGMIRVHNTLLTADD